MLEIKEQRIILDGEVVGVYSHSKTPSAPTHKVIEMFDPRCQDALQRLCRGVRRIDYIWVSDIAINSKWRRQGIASRILNRISAEPGTLIACAPGSGVKGGMRMSHDDRIAFYRSLKFTIVIGQKHDYAFKFTPYG